MQRSLILGLALGALLCPVPGHAALRVVAAVNDLAAIAQAVGGDLVEIDVVARPDRDPHTVAVRPSTMRKTARADVYLEVGLDLDLWSTDIIRGSRNRDLHRIDCSQGIEPEEVPTGEVDASMGDVHPRGNPHYWLDPLNAVHIAERLAVEFATLDAEHRNDYAANAASFSDTIRQRLPVWSERLTGGMFVEFHRTWIYLAQRFDMRIVGQVEPLPGIPPTARHLAELSDIIRSTGASVVVRDHFHNQSPLEFLERETGIRSVLLPSMCDEPTADSYLRHFDRIAETLGSRARTDGSPPAREGSR